MDIKYISYIITGNPFYEAKRLTCRKEKRNDHYVIAFIEWNFSSWLSRSDKNPSTAVIIVIRSLIFHPTSSGGGRTELNTWNACISQNMILIASRQFAFRVLLLWDSESWENPMKCVILLCYPWKSLSSSY